MVGEGALVQALTQAGFTITDSEADYVVLGETPFLRLRHDPRARRTSSAAARASWPPTPTWPGPRAGPSCGAFAAPIERITGQRPFYVGKPNALMMRAALRYMQAHSEETVIVGDNMDTDIIAGINSGMETVLVLSGREPEGRPGRCTPTARTTW